MNDAIPMPPLEYQALVCGSNGVHHFEEVGRGLVNMLDHYGMLSEGVEFLDVGCGCARVARYFMDRSVKSYTGFDRHKGMIEWCRQQITSRDPRFQFNYFELKSVYSVLDNEQGTIDVKSFRFPWADESFDSVFLASVFTHMPPGEVKAYLGEIARVLRPKGKALASIFFAPGELETRGRGTNVFHNADRFLGDLACFPFDALLVNPETPARSFSCEHNWYLLKRRKP